MQVWILYLCVSVCLSVSQAPAHCCSLWDGKSGTGACSQGSRPQRKGPQWWDTLPVVSIFEITFLPCLLPTHSHSPRQHSSSVLCSHPACSRVFGVYFTGHARTEGHGALRLWSSYKTASSLYTLYWRLVTDMARRLCWNDLIQVAWEIGLPNHG